MPTQPAIVPGSLEAQAPGVVGKRFAAPTLMPPTPGEITSVWAKNLEEEIERIRDVVETFSHVAMDAQFSGLVSRPTGAFNHIAEYNYQTLKWNVDLTEALSMSMSFMDEDGNRPPSGPCTWRFNFHYDKVHDLIAEDADLRDLDLGRHESEGVDRLLFAELLTTSGLVLNEDIRWITYAEGSRFHELSADTAGGPDRPREPPWVTFCSMYTFGHLLQLLTCQALPREVAGFVDSLGLFFPRRCDLARHTHRLSPLRELSKKGTFFRKAQTLIQAFFLLPEAVRRTAFDDDEEEEQVAMQEVDWRPKHHRKRRSREQDRRLKAFHKAMGERAREVTTPTRK